MTPPAPDPVWDRLDDFERQARSDPTVNPADFLLPPDHPSHLRMLVELVRLDMDLAWDRGTPRLPEHYLAQFPALAADEAAAAVAYEDFRLRRLAGLPVLADDYRDRYQVRTDDWPDEDEPERAEDTLANRRNATPAEIPHRAVVRVPPPDLALSPPPVADVLRSWVATLVLGPECGDPLQSLRRTAPVQIAEWSAAIAALPVIGTTFLGFELTEELGRGAFGRVYLAKQAGLAGRPVALKIGTGLVGESHTLAQLQHTNIVPIYSAHEDGPLQAVCMPFFGRVTLGHLLANYRTRGKVSASAAEVIDRFASSRSSEPPANGMWEHLRPMTYPDAVAWIGSQLAAGLMHAHTRGIVHRDLKPANVLLTDDGVPMLLDFNIAEDTKLRGTAAAASIGGTLPYMAPEQLAVYAGRTAPIDARIDLYAAGVILFELLTGTRPFPDRPGPVELVIGPMLADRRGPLPAVRASNPQVPASLEAVVHKLLAFDPAQRYQSAKELQDDLDRHLKHLPLKSAPEPSVRERVRKWARRHPRLTSSGSVTAVAGAVLALTAGAGFAIRERARSLEARVAFEDHGRELRALQALLDDRNQTRESLDDGITRSRQCLARYEVDARDWDRNPLVRYLPEENRAKLREGIGEVYYLMAKASARRADLASVGEEKTARLEDARRWNELAERYGEHIPRAVREQRADLLRSVGRAADADRWADEARQMPPATARDRYLLGYWHYQQGRYRQALPELIASTAQDSTNFSAWFVRGVAHLSVEQNDLAAMCFTACLALRPDFVPGWMNRGIALAKLRQPELALADYDEAIRLDPDRPDAHVLRAGVFHSTGKFREAAEGYSTALARPGCPTRVYFYRATVRHEVGDKAGAAADRTAALAQTPTDTLSWVARAEARLETPDAALVDVEAALREDPSCLPAMQLKAHLLAERLDRPQDAIAVLTRAVDLYPDNVEVRAGRGVLRARAGDRDGALKDADEALLRDSRPSNLYQVGCVYALTAKTHPADRFKAVELLAAALTAGYGRDYLATDHDLDPIRMTAEFRPLLTRFAPPAKGR